jgi:hypothetical protein
MRSTTPSKKGPRPPLLFVGLLVVLGIAAAVALSPFIGSHQGPEIFLQILSPSPTSTCFDKYCSAVCPAGYYATAGKCATNDVSPTSWNLAGVLPSRQSWDCFLDSYFAPPSYVTASATCLKVGDWEYIPYQMCGNYKIEPATGQPGSIKEICDKTNLNGYSCEDFIGADGTQLCNGKLACSPACNQFDISQCEYCGSGSCSWGMIECNDDTCAIDCSGNGGPKGPNGNTYGGGGGSGGTPNFPYCGNGLIEIGEQCDASLNPTEVLAQCQSTMGFSPAPGYHFDCMGCQCILDKGPSGGGNMACDNDGIVESGEQCDGDPAACTAAFGPAAAGFHYTCANCQCSSTEDGGGGGPMACNNNNTKDPGEECDGTDVGSCPPVTGPGVKKTCTDCKCGYSECGNGIKEGSEECDGDPSVCYTGPMTGGSYFCSFTCSCVWDPFFD